jgi:hypothetical protein
MSFRLVTDRGLVHNKDTTLCLNPRVFKIGSTIGQSSTDSIRA